MEVNGRVRRASHANSWYNGEQSALGQELDGYLRPARRAKRPEGRVKALISPHAGYRYCGRTGAYGFGAIDPSSVKRVFVLGPSHHVYLRTAALPANSVVSYETPFGELQLDRAVIQDLQASEPNLFTNFKLRDDEAEHSVEMQLPYLAFVMQGQPFTIVPLVIGSTSADIEARIGRALAPYFLDPQTLFVISSDFCHWGKRFQYTHLRSLSTVNGEQLVHDPARLPINAGIELLDRAGMNLIERQDLVGFRRYLQEEQNTICGQHPICVLLEILNLCREQHNAGCTFLHYSQSSQLTKNCHDDSCVSYASGIVVV
jgi:AmmeMemoRadiSam system protein B